MNGPITINPVKGMVDFLAFCRVPRQIYRDMAGFTPPLDAEQWTMFARKLNHHYDKVEDCKWLARRDGKIVGRICAQVYKDIQPVGASKAQFGALDCIDDCDVAGALLRTAEAWLAARGAAVIHGPYTPSVSNESGALISGFAALRTIGVPWHPPYLHRLIEAQGYEKAQDLLSYRFNLPDKWKPVATPFQDRAAVREKLVFRSLRMDQLKTEVPLMLELFNDGWRQNWGYVPLSAREMDSFAQDLKYVMTENYGFFAEKDGEPIAFGLVIPNIQETVSDLGGRLLPTGIFRLISRIRAHKFNTARLMLFGVRQKYQKGAIGGLILMMLIEELHKRGRMTKFEYVEFGWVLETNLGMRKAIELSDSTIDKIHRIYEKRLD